MLATEISIVDAFKKTSSKCCIDSLRPPRLSGCGKEILGFVVSVGLCAVTQSLWANYNCTVSPDFNVTLSQVSDIPSPIITHTREAVAAMPILLPFPCDMERPKATFR
jgi:hypothetical protein